MSRKTKPVLNTQALTKKYKCDVNKIIRCWKNNNSDFEISRALGIDMLKLLQIRQEILQICEKERQKHMRSVSRYRILQSNRPRL